MCWSPSISAWLRASLLRLRKNSAGARTVGREAEFPIVGQRGEAVDARRLWNVLLETDDLTPEYGTGAPGHAPFIVGLGGADYSYALEVGLGTIEISTRPCRTLLEIEMLMRAAVGRLVRAAGRFGWRVLGYGIQPVSPPTIGLMSPKQRYLSLYRAMGASLALVYGDGFGPAPVLDPA